MTFSNKVVATYIVCIYKCQSQSLIQAVKLTTDRAKEIEVV